MRLVNGSNDREGRVEVLYKGEWGTVCGDDFDIRDANVICRMMGFPGALSAGINGRFGPGNSSQRVLLDDLWCSGHENSVASCSFRGWGSHNCHHKEDAGVVCKEKIPGMKNNTNVFFNWTVFSPSTNLISYNDHGRPIWKITGLP